MTTSRHIRPDKFGIASAFEIDDGFLDLIVAGSNSADRKMCGTLEIQSGEHGNLGGWVASRPTDAETWTFACVAEPTPRSLLAYVSDIELDENGEVPEVPSHETFDGNEPAKLETGVEFKPGDMVRLLAPNMIVLDVSAGEITCTPADAPGSVAGTYPAATLGRIAPAGAA